MHCILRSSIWRRFNFVTYAKFEVAQPIHCRLIVFYCWYVKLRCDLGLTPWTLNICSIPAVPWSNSVPNLSEIEQTAAEWLRFEHLTLWPWTCITCCAMLWDIFHQVSTQSSYPLMKYWALTRWPWKLAVDLVSHGSKFCHITSYCDVDLWPLDLEHVW